MKAGLVPYLVVLGLTLALSQTKLVNGVIGIPPPPSHRLQIMFHILVMKVVLLTLVLMIRGQGYQFVVSKIKCSQRLIQSA